MIVKEKKWGNIFACEKVICDYCGKSFIFERYLYDEFMRTNKCKRCKRSYMLTFWREKQ